jgi:hypothetical protein
MKVGVSFHFGMNTFTGNDYDQGTEPATTYAPTALNVDQWLAAAELIGARYAILTAKHMSGFCLWDAKNYSYDVAASGNPTDVVAAFVAACRWRHIIPGLYYCILDPRNEHNQGHVDWTGPVSNSYFNLIRAQISELHRRYRPLGMQLIDIPGKLSSAERWELYRVLKSLDPHCLMMFNQTWSPSQTNRGSLCIPAAWPTDIILSEDAVPPVGGTIRGSPSATRATTCRWPPGSPPAASTVMASIASGFGGRSSKPAPVQSCSAFTNRPSPATPAFCSTCHPIPAAFCLTSKSIDCSSWQPLCDSTAHPSAKGPPMNRRKFVQTTAMALTSGQLCATTPNATVAPATHRGRSLSS